jgi:hypothetical protein
MSARDGIDLKAAPLHKAFSWLRPDLEHDHDAQFVATAHDVCKGIATCLQLVQNSNMVRSNQDDFVPGDEDAPLLDIGDTERLMLFAQAAAQMLGEDAERRIERLNERAQKKAKQ